MSKKHGRTPGVDVEQGHDGHGDVPSGKVEGIGECSGIGVEDGGAVGVEHALGEAGGAAVGCVGVVCDGCVAARAVGGNARPPSTNQYMCKHIRRTHLV